MTLSPEQLVAIVIALLSGGAIGGVREWIKDRRRQPIDTSAALVAMAQSAGAQALAVTDQLQEEVTRLRGEQAQDRVATCSLRNRVGVLETELRGWGRWYAWLAGAWPQIRLRPVAPEPPVSQMMPASQSILEP